MTAGIWNPTLEQGSTFRRVLTWKDSADAPINLTGYTARMQFRETKASDEAIVNLTSTDGITLGGALGTIEIVIPATVTAGITQKTLLFDLELVNGATVYRVVEGVALVSGNVTK